MIKNDEYKECFNSFEDCFSKEYFYYYNDTCFKNNCTSDKISLGSLTNNNSKIGIINQLNLIDSTINDGLCICNTFDIFENKTYLGWINNVSNPFIQICLNECPEDYFLDEITNRCFLCNFIFNNKCYKDQCPEKTKLNLSEPNSRNCVCQELSIIDNETGLITCKDKEYPIDSTLGDVLEKFVKDIGNISNANSMAPITLNSGDIVYGYNSEENKDDLIRKYSNITYINIDSCIDTVRQSYNLPTTEKIYIFVIDSPNYSINSLFSFYYYKFYLENGTQLDLGSIENLKISISSAIINPDIINYNKSKYFNQLGYDIYNKSDKFYTDCCAPASDDGNDITLNDRFKYYYPSNTSLCSDGCEYNSVDYENQRMICDCAINNININNSNISNNNGEDEAENDESYLDYFLSLINYKIALCYHLFFNFSSFYYNAGFYISFTTLMICMILMFLFWIIAIKQIKVLFYKNLPTKTKLYEINKKNNEKKKHNSINIITQKNTIKKSKENEIIKNSNPPPIKNKNNSNLDNKDEQMENDLNNNFDTYFRKKTKRKTRKKTKKCTDDFTNIKNISDSNLNFEKSNHLEEDKTNRTKLLRKSKKLSMNPKRIQNKLFSYIKKDSEKTSKDKNDTGLNIDFNYDHLVNNNNNDDEIDKNELNDIPYIQALRIDKRQLIEIFTSIFIKEIGILNIFFYRNIYSHFSLVISTYLLESLLDLTLNFLLYSDDVVSEKYNNNGNLSFLTSLTLSFISNIVSSIIIFLISKLVNYPNIIEAIIKMLNIKTII